MKKYIPILILVFAAAVYAIPPGPPYVLPSNITANVTGSLTGDVTGTATGLSGTPNITVGTCAAGSFSGNGADITAISAAHVTGLRTDNVGNSNVPYVNASGNLDNLGFTNGLVLSGGNLTLANPVVSSLSVSGNVYMSVTVNGSNSPSGTPVIITILDIATNTPYYFYAYPASGI